MTDFEVGKIIRFHRKRLGLTQQELAARIGVTWEMISRYERGRSSAVQKLLDIARELEISPSILVQETHDTPFIADKKDAYTFDSYLPVVRTIPRRVQDLQQLVKSSVDGMRSPVPGALKRNTVFLLELSGKEKLRIDAPYIFSKGYLVCIFPSNDTLSADDTVIANVKEVITLTKYFDGMSVIAKVIQWVIPL